MIETKCTYPLRKQTDNERYSGENNYRSQLVVSGGAKRRRRTTRCYFEKVLEDVVVSRISGNIGCISVEIFMNISSIRYMPQRQFSGHILN
jgi:hypothetical protein